MDAEDSLLCAWDDDSLDNLESLHENHLRESGPNQTQEVQP